jgi:hypothetical protein
MQTSKGRIVSKKAHAAGLVAIKRLRNAGFVAKKGEFKLFTPKSKKSSPVKRTVKTRAMTKANHKKRHNAAVKAWGTRRAHASPKVGGAKRKNSRKDSRKTSRKTSRKNRK